MQTTSLVIDRQTPQLFIEADGLDGLSQYIASKIQKDSRGGRPHFIVELRRRGRDPREELLNIFEAVWLKGRPIRNVAREYRTGYNTIMRILEDCQPLKKAAVYYLQTSTRRKRFYDKRTDRSDYQTVQRYIDYAHREGLKSYKTVLYGAGRVWRLLNCTDPKTWTALEVIRAVETLPVGAQGKFGSDVRQIAPQLREKGGENEFKVGRFRAKVKRHRIDVFGKEFLLIRQCLEEKGLGFELTIFLLHVATGAREGSEMCSDKRAGMTGLTWDRFHADFTLIDVYESKVKDGIWSRDCPLDLLFPDLPGRLRELWKERGKPATDKLILGGYDELVRIYKKICKANADYFRDKVDPGLLKQLTTIKPRYADKLHCNLLWEADVPLEVVAGQYLGQGEGVGLVGRIWLKVDTIKDYYLSLTRRSTKFQKIMNQIRKYSRDIYRMHQKVKLPLAV